MASNGPPEAIVDQIVAKARASLPSPLMVSLLLIPVTFPDISSFPSFPVCIRVPFPARPSLPSVKLSRLTKTVPGPLQRKAWAPWFRP